MSPLGSALRRFLDYDADPATPLPFAEVAPLINLHRLRLAAALSVADMLQQVYLSYAGEWGTDSWICLAALPIYAALFFVALIRPPWLNSPPRQHAFVIAAVVFGLVVSICATASLAWHGRLVSGYSLDVLAVAAVFLFPLRQLVALLGPATLLYICLVQRAAVSDWEKLVASTTALLVTASAIAFGWLLYGARERDHGQQQLISEQARQIAAREAHLDELMAITAHDLQSPLLGLYNLFDLTLEKARSDPSLPGRVLSDSQKSLKAMLDLVRRLLLAHRAEQHSVVPLVRDDLRLHVTAAIDRVLPIAERAGVTVAADLQNTPAIAAFDPVAVAQILDNLLTNAVRFSPHGDRVAARCVCRDAMVAIIVADNGPGVAQDLEPILFHKFQRGDVTHGNGPHGTGFGLFIASTLAGKNGGSLAYRPGELAGACFELLLPRVP